MNFRIYPFQMQTNNTSDLKRGFHLYFRENIPTMKIFID